MAGSAAAAALVVTCAMDRAAAHGPGERNQRVDRAVVTSACQVWPAWSWPAVRADADPARERPRPAPGRRPDPVSSHNGAPSVWRKTRLGSGQLLGRLSLEQDTASPVLERRRRTTVCFSGVADAQLRRDVREYTAVYGCVRALTAAVVAVTVAVGDTTGPRAMQAGSRIKGGRC